MQSNSQDSILGSAPSAAERVQLDMPDAEVIYYPQLFSTADANRLLEILLAETDWRQEHIKIYNKEIPLPRLTAWCGDAGKIYTYSGIRLTASPWTDALREIKTRIEVVSDATFNSVLINRYRHGADSVAWHSDDEKELGRNPIIGSVSLGAARKFQMKHKTDKAQKTRDMELTHGSYLLMQGATQYNWTHQIPKIKNTIGERINLTFRVVQSWHAMANAA